MMAHGLFLIEPNSRINDFKREFRGGTVQLNAKLMGAAVFYSIL